MEAAPGGDDVPKMKKVQLAERWRDWPFRRQYERITYSPGEGRLLNHGSRINSWQGLGVVPKKGDVGPWRKLLDHLFKDVPRAERLWFERWCGYPLKHPGTKLSSAVGLWGPQGSGKSLIAEKTLGVIYGRNFQAIGQQQLEDDFNDWGVNKQLVLVDEVCQDEARKRGNHVKKLITQDVLRVNTKYLAGYDVKDYANYFMTSNSPRAFFVEDGDRRYFIHQTPADLLPRAFFTHYLNVWLRFHAKPNYGPGPAALLYYFLNDLDYGDFDPHAPPPVTKAKQEMSYASLPPVEAWLHDFPHSELFVQHGSREIWNTGELCLLYNGADNRARPLSSNVFSSHAGAAGYVRQLCRVGDGMQRLLAITNLEKWRAAPGKEWAAEALRGTKPEKF
jgi:hypothetical protein